MEYTRQPCPVRIVEDCGCAFMMGCIGGSLFEFMKGFRNAPSGLTHSLYSGLDAVKMKAPMIAGSFAVWGATFSTVDCSMLYCRQREDSWNSIVSGAATGAILAARNGVKAMANSAIVSGLVLAMIEGAGAVVTTLYAAEPLVGPDGKPQRPQWEFVSNAICDRNAIDLDKTMQEIAIISNKSSERLSAVHVVVEEQEQEQELTKQVKPLSLLEKIKLANVF